MHKWAHFISGLINPGHATYSFSFLIGLDQMPCLASFLKEWTQLQLSVLVFLSFLPPIYFLSPKMQERRDVYLHFIIFSQAWTRHSALHHQTAFLSPLLLSSSRARQQSLSITGLPEVSLLSLKLNWCSPGGKEKQKQSLVFLTCTHCQAAQPDLFENSNVLPSDLP